MEEHPTRLNPECQCLIILIHTQFRAMLLIHRVTLSSSPGTPAILHNILHNNLAIRAILLSLANSHLVTIHLTVVHSGDNSS